MRKNQTLTTAIPLMAAMAGWLSLTSGCEGSLSDQLKGQEPAVMTGQNGRITNTLESSGAVVSLVDASDMMSWVYVQLATGTEVKPQDPLHSSDWDLALQRFQIKVNGGINGQGGVEVALVTNTAFPALTTAPKTGYVTDQTDSADEDTEPDYAFLQTGTWYNYNPMNHVLTPKEQVYVVRSATGSYYKIQMTGYYDQAGSSGFPAFRWQPVTAP